MTPPGSQALSKAKSYDKKKRKEKEERKSREEKSLESLLLAVCMSSWSVVGLSSSSSCLFFSSTGECRWRVVSKGALELQGETSGRRSTAKKIYLHRDGARERERHRWRNRGRYLFCSNPAGEGEDGFGTQLPHSKEERPE